MTKQETLENLKQLGFNVQKISELSGIPSARIYKWYKGNGLPKADDYNLLLDVYERFKRNPTKDFHANIAAEPDAIYKTDKDVLIDNLQQQIKDLRADKQRLIDDLDYLKFKYEELLGKPKRKDIAG